MGARVGGIFGGIYRCADPVSPYLARALAVNSVPAPTKHRPETRDSLGPVSISDDDARPDENPQQHPPSSRMPKQQPRHQIIIDRLVTKRSR
jgi:hypothetical protein